MLGVDSAPSGPVRSANAGVTFTVDDPTATAWCAVDAVPAAICTSPQSYGTLPTGAWSMRIDESVSAHRISLASSLGGVVKPDLATDAPTLGTGRGIIVGANGIGMAVDYFIVIETEVP